MNSNNDASWAGSCTAGPDGVGRTGVQLPIQQGRASSRKRANPYLQAAVDLSSPCPFLGPDRLSHRGRHALAPCFGHPRARWQVAAILFDGNALLVSPTGISCEGAICQPAGIFDARVPPSACQRCRRPGIAPGRSHAGNVDVAVRLALDRTCCPYRVHARNDPLVSIAMSGPVGSVSYSGRFCNDRQPRATGDRPTRFGAVRGPSIHPLGPWRER